MINWTYAPFQATQLSLRLLLSFIAIGLVFVAVADVPNTSFLFEIARFIVISAAIAIVFLPIRYSVPLLVLMLITGRDIDAQATASIWNFSVGFANPSWFVFLLVAAQLFKLRKSLKIPLFLKVAIVWFTVIPVLMGIIFGDLNGSFAAAEWIVDLKLPMLIFGMFILISTFIRINPSQGIIVLSVLVAGLTARHLADLLYLFIGYGPTFEGSIDGANRVSLDSTKSGIVFLVILGILLVATLPRKAVWGFLIAIPTVMVAESYGTRMIWVEFFLTIPIILIMVKWRQLPLAIITIAIVLVAGSGALYVLHRETADFAFGRAQTAAEGETPETFLVDVEYNFLSRIDPLRYAQIVDILETAGNRKSWVFGSGYGSYYTDIPVRFPTHIKTSFSDENYEAGRFYRSHTFVMHFFHKYGVAGLVIMISFWTLPAYVLIRRFRRESKLPSMEILLVGALTAFMLTAMVENTWSGKGYAFNGVLLALTIHYAVQTLSDSGELKKLRRWLI